jgi:hypothetical protein
MDCQRRVVLVTEEHAMKVSTTVRVINRYFALLGAGAVWLIGSQLGVFAVSDQVLAQSNGVPGRAPVANTPVANTPVANTMRDPEIAVREEFDGAMRKGTVQAIELFILRHPKHALVVQARKRRGALLGPELERRPIQPQ